ncbi:MAG: hypothetical protein QMC97_05330 [Pseudothermotoga sp.]|uniref:hypothetical protein n=1 Tax=Pseudothermotoga sp. TaxID=2033661 RepID=UPI0025838381|nr:hypothetical protein [Pseudothermotoga sp.]MDI6862787.1 hypothetical protein [Pseudothermotoga sp.]
MKTVLYLALIIGVLWSTFGLVMLIGYSLLSYASPFLNDILNVTVKSSRWFLAFALSFLASGMCICLYSLAKANGDNHVVFLSFAFSSSALSIAIQIYRMVVSGIGWFAYDLLGSYGEIGLVKLVSVGLLALSLIFFSFQFSLIRMERYSP